MNILHRVTEHGDITATDRRPYAAILPVRNGWMPIVEKTLHDPITDRGAPTPSGQKKIVMPT